MTLLVYRHLEELFQLLVTLARFLLTVLLGLGELYKY